MTVFHRRMVRKYVIPVDSREGAVIDIPMLAHFLHCLPQRGVKTWDAIALWYEVDPDEILMTEHRFHLYETGKQIKGHVAYVGSVLLASDTELHIYEEVTSA